MFENILDMLFPPKCGFCGKINKNFLCKKCEVSLNYIKKDMIRKVKNKNFSYHIYAYEYRNEIRDKILKFKFGDKPELADTFVELLLKNTKTYRFLESYDIIIPVPMQKKKKRERGYNQAALMARKIAKKTGIKYAEDVLIKVKHTEPQSTLNASKRKENIKNAYKCINIEKILNKRVILFDDIYTTGNTAKECCKMLKNAGAKEIAVYTFAKD